MSSGYLDADTLLERTAPLVDARSGLIAPPDEVLVETGTPDIVVYSSRVSMLTRTEGHISLRLDGDKSMYGSGSSTERDLAKAKAICEALERYCNYSFDARRVITASRDELGDAAVDLNRFPRGRPEEYSDPGAIPRNDLPIRWVRGYSLTQSRPLYVPFSSVYISSPFEWAGESFAQPISTGSALAASYERAVVTAVQELVERDTLTLSWLHQLPLPRIELGPNIGAELRERLERTAARGIEQHFFDATTDIGLPTAYCLQWQPDGEVAMMAMAATRFDMESALVRVSDEAASSRAAIAGATRRPRPYDPLDFRTFNRLTDGAVYYADPANRAAFDFLMQGERRIGLDAIRQREGTPPLSANAMLDRLVARFRELDYELCVVDMSAAPVADCGLYAVHVVAPDLLPLTVNFNMKFGATPRLYDAPARMGLQAKAFADLNPWPQPFA